MFILRILYHIETVNSIYRFNPRLDTPLPPPPSRTCNHKIKVKFTISCEGGATKVDLSLVPRRAKYSLGTRLASYPATNHVTWI